MRKKCKITQLTDTIHSIVDAVRNIEWAIFDSITMSTSIDTVQKVLAETKRDELSQHKAILDSLLAAKHQRLLDVLPAMDSINSAIGSQTTISGQNVKTINALLIKRLGEIPFTTTEETTIANIANQCAGYGGEAVYTARTLLAEIELNTTVYDDECIQTLPRTAKPVQSMDTEYGITVYPNPANYFITIALPENHTCSTLQIQDISGNIVQEVNILPGQRTLHLSAAPWPSGMYFVSAVGTDMLSFKFVILE